MDWRTTIGQQNLQMSNKPIKTMKAMKKTFRFLSMAALALMGAVMTGCSSDDNIDNAQPENKSKVVTLTAKVGFDASVGTRALDASGHKTFATGDKMAVIYKNTSGGFKRADGTLSSGAGTQSATFDITLSDPDNTAPIRYIYPAAMAKEESELGATINDDASTVDFTKLNTQDGTLAKLGSDLDLCILDTPAGWSTTELPSGTLSNKLAILAITLKSSGDINNTIKGMTISDGTYCYSVDRTPSDGAIYVAIRPTSGATISVSATNSDVSQTYIKNLTGKTYEKNNGYVLNWTMTASSYRMASAATSEDKGKQICAAGHIHPAGGDAGCTQTRVAKIVYVGNETGESPFGFIHGLALAMSDANSGNTCAWSTSMIKVHTYNTESSSFASESGLQYNTTHNDNPYPAFKAAIANNGTAAPTGCSAWFLASGYQWTKMFAGDAGGLKTLAGLQSDDYGSSTERNASLAWFFYSGYGYWFSDGKGVGYLVRSCLAF